MAVVVVSVYDGFYRFSINILSNLTSPAFRHTIEVHPVFRVASL